MTKLKCLKISTFVFLLLIAKSIVEARPLNVVTTIEDLAAIVREIGGVETKVHSLTKGTQNPHSIQVRPSDMIRVSRADLFVQVGLELEPWVSPVLDGARNPKVRIGEKGHVNCSQGIEILEIPQGKIDRSMGDIHPEGNPHYWLDPYNGKIIAENILEGLIRIRPESTKLFKENYDSFESKLDQKIKVWKQWAKPIKNIRIITYHKSWSYFAKSFDIRVVNYLEPKEGIPPSPKHIQAIISQIRQENIPLLILEPYFDPRLPQKVQDATHIRLVELAPSVNVSAGIKNYFDLFEVNIQRLLKAVQK